MDVKLITDINVNADRFISILLTRNKGHVGIIYKLQDEQVKNLHFKNEIKQDTKLPAYAFFKELLVGDTNEEKLILQSLVTKLALIEEGDYINYGFNYGDDSTSWWNEDATFDVNEKQHLGLTCATFVWIVLRDLGYPTCLFDTWPEREDDKIWQQDLIQQQIAMPSPITGIRLRPIEAMACATSPDIPVCYANAIEMVINIENQINKHLSQTVRVGSVEVRNL